MAYCTLGQVAAHAQALLADNRAVGPQLYDNIILLPYIKQAVRDLFRMMRKITDTQIIRDAYHILAANTSVLYPETASINDLARPISIEERGNLTSKSISDITKSAVTNLVTAVTTSAAHGFSTGDQITINEVVGLTGTEGIWAVTVSNTTNFIPNGCVVAGMYESGGVAVKSTDEFAQMDKTERIWSLSTAAPKLRQWAWQDKAFRFQPSDEDRQLRIRYLSSATVPVSESDTIAIDDCLDFLAADTAALAAMTIAPDISDRMRALAFGRSGDANASGGLIRDLLINYVLAEQERPPEERQRLSFREPRPSYE